MYRSDARNATAFVVKTTGVDFGRLVVDVNGGMVLDVPRDGG
jgi:hypothetical protein